LAILSAVEPENGHVALCPRAFASLGNFERQQRHELSTMLEECARPQSSCRLDFIAYAARDVAIGENAAARDTATARGIEASAFASCCCHWANVEAR
jgi:hypothetical protein